MLSEKDMEDAICGNPEKYLGEAGLKLIARQYRIGNYIFDLLFEDRHGAKLIVEIQKGTLDRNHLYKILDYYDEYKEKNPNSFIELMVIANQITYERRKRLYSKGISWKEISELEFPGQNNNVNVVGSLPRTPSTPNASRTKGNASQKNSHERERNIENGRWGGQMRSGLHRAGCESGNIDETILRLIKQNEAINPQSLAQVTGYSISRIKSHLKHLEMAHGIAFPA